MTTSVQDRRARRPGGALRERATRLVERLTTPLLPADYLDLFIADPQTSVVAARALGLGYWKMMAFVILPQALKLVIPGMVNSFIALFKDTTLVLIVAIFDFLGQLRAAGVGER